MNVLPYSIDRCFKIYLCKRAINLQATRYILTRIESLSFILCRPFSEFVFIAFCYEGDGLMTVTDKGIFLQFLS